MNTQKPVQGLKFALLAGAFLFAGCDIFSSREQNAPLKSAKQPQISYALDSDALAYLNEYRKGSGLYKFIQNQNLTLAAQNHADYSAEHKFMGHDESAAQAKFTGATPADRAVRAGYGSLHVLENIAYKNDFKDAIDGLFSAIYHRFGFLDLSVDEVGFASAGKEKFSAFVFEMGNAKINEFCKKGVSDGGSGRFYTNICSDKKMKLKDAKFDDFTASNKPYVKFPDATPVIAYFSGEIPDPFPECKITANPVSIEFNPKFKDINFKKFEIYKDGKKLENLHVITSKNDVNAKFSPRQFAVFSREVFEFGARYEAVFDYELGGKAQQVKWGFTTKTPQNPYFDATDGDVLGVEADKTYEIFFRPRDCNDLLASYTYSVSGFAKPVIKQSGANTLSVKLSGMAGDTLSIKAGGVLVKVRLKTTSPAAAKDRRNYYIKSAFAIFAVIIVFVLIGRNYRR